VANSDAATVVAQLLAFSKEPIRYRKRLTNGRETFPGGLTVFRLAQGRFPQGLLRDLSQSERERIRQAATVFIRQVCLWEGATHYQVLCVPPDAGRQAIKEHYHGLIALIHPDRQDPESEHWPAQAAQRVNRAYEVLSDEAKRHEYDAGLRKATPGPAPVTDAIVQAARQEVAESAPAMNIASKWQRMRRHVLPVALVLSALFYGQMWWAAKSVDQTPGPEREATFEQYYRWTRNLLSDAGGPRFVGQEKGAENAARGARQGTDDVAGSLLGRLTQAFSEPPRTVVAPEPRKLAAAPPAAGAGIPDAVRVPGRGAGAVTASREPAGKAGASLRDNARAESVATPSRALQGVPPAIAADMELLLVRLIAFYEAGDVDKLMSLVDAERMGVWERMRVRLDFEDFFRSTRARRLQIDWINWETADGHFNARGQATVRAEYVEQDAPAVRTVPITLRVETGADQLRLARITLFPHE